VLCRYLPIRCVDVYQHDFSIFRGQIKCYSCLCVPWRWKQHILSKCLHHNTRRHVVEHSVLYSERCASLICSILVEGKFVSHCCYTKEDGRSVDMRWRLDVRDYTGPIKTRTLELRTSESIVSAKHLFGSKNLWNTNNRNIN